MPNFHGFTSRQRRRGISSRSTATWTTRPLGQGASHGLAQRLRFVHAQADAAGDFREQHEVRIANADGFGERAYRAPKRTLGADRFWPISAARLGTLVDALAVIRLCAWLTAVQRFC